MEMISIPKTRYQEMIAQIERLKVLEVLTREITDEHKEFLSHILNITSRVELNGVKGYTIKLLPCSFYGKKHDVISLRVIEDYEVCLAEKARRFCPFYNNDSISHCNYLGNKP